MAGEVERTLYDATIGGDVIVFEALLQQNPYLRDGASFAYSRNILHIATMWDQAAIVRDLLARNPKLASDLDSKNSSALHIAAAKGNLPIATMLLPEAPDMCWSRDCQGMNPFHIAAKNGHLRVLELFLDQPRPSSAMERADRGQTVLHLCVKHRQLEALRFLVGRLGALVQAKDDDGETLLHWAVRFKQLEMVQYLVTTNIDVMSTNSMLYTPMEISKKMPQDAITLQIQEALRGGMRYFGGATDPNSRMRDAIMVVVALIASVAFDAIINPPGGVWQDNSSTHRAGSAIMAYNKPLEYIHFLVFNTLAFAASLLTMFMMISENPSLIPITSTVAFLAFGAALTCVGVSYAVSLMMIIPSKVNPVTHLVLFAYLGVVLVVFVAFIRAGRR